MVNRLPQKITKGAMIIVSHDKRFINAVTKKTLEVYLGKFNTFNGDYDGYLKFKEKETNRQLINILFSRKRLKRQKNL